jgi:formylglycine-generating enzyme required for sulfatase activity
VAKFKVATIILFLVFPMALLSLAQDEQQRPNVEIFSDLRGIPMVFIPSGELHSGIELEEAVNQCLSLMQAEGFPPFDPKQVCSKDFLREASLQSITIDINVFYMDQFEVSRSDYLECIKADVCSKEPLERQPSEMLDIPVQYATYIDASIYCAWRGARLPTAFEWEYAARGTKDLTYVWGNEFKGNDTNHCDVNCKVLESSDASKSIWDDKYSDVGPVDAFKNDKSWAGVYNLAGNIAEWTSTTLNSDVPSFYDFRIIKGGSYLSYPYMTAGWFTQQRNLAEGQADIGFRCVRTSKP